MRPEESHVNLGPAPRPTPRRRSSVPNILRALGNPLLRPAVQCAAISHDGVGMSGHCHDAGFAQAGRVIAVEVYPLRKLTTGIATWVRDSVQLADGDRPHGILYPSKMGPERWIIGRCGCGEPTMGPAWIR